MPYKEWHDVVQSYGVDAESVLWHADMSRAVRIAPFSACFEQPVPVIA